MIETLSWWLGVQALSFAVLPIALRWLRWLPDRGYFFAKPLGVLLVSYLLWLGASLSIIDNTTAAIVLLTIGLAIGSWFYKGGDAVGYLKARWRFVLGVEVLFTLAFALWALVRAYNPAIAATEKPMEIAFLSAVLRNAHFPPVDPWLSGFGISYYYFGYVAMAMLAKLSGVAAPVAFNLAIALLFAMTVAGAFSLGYNLVARRHATTARAINGGAVACGLLASLLVAISADLEGIIEILNAKSLLSPSVLRWLQINDLPAPYVSPGWLPGYDWWWFRAARVISDIDPITKATRDYTINEFPYFSFLLGDLHPHVLALPFAVFAVAVALNLFYSEDVGSAATLLERRFELLMVGLLFGGLGFLNSWDMPTYLLLLALTFGVRRFRLLRRLDGALLKEVVAFGLLTGLASIVLYLPFYIGFQSQAQGLGFVVVHTKLRHFAIFWGPLFVLLVAWIVAEFRRQGRVALPSAILPGRLELAVPSPQRAPAAAHSQPPAGRATRDSMEMPRRHTTPRGDLDNSTPASDGHESGHATHRLDAPSDATGRSFASFPLWAVFALAIVVVALLFFQADVTALLLVLLVLGGFALWRRLQYDEEDSPAMFVSLLLLVGMLLILICEWVFIRDYFNNRMNTVFKLYYQAWLMLAVAGAYVLYYLAIRPVRAVGFTGRNFAILAVALLVLASSLVYPPAAMIAKTNGFSGQPTLDGQAFMAGIQPGDYEAIRWLQATVTGTPVILEATGGSYSAAGRVSAFTGLPTLLGWDFHEQQWRGSTTEQAKRKPDIDTIYSSNDRALVQSLLRKYGVTYVYVGPLERETYGKFGPAALDKFAGFMDVVYRNNTVTIYRVRG